MGRKPCFSDWIQIIFAAHKEFFLNAGQKGKDFRKERFKAIFYILRVASYSKDLFYNFFMEVALLTTS